MAKVLRERWYVYEIDDEGRLKEPSYHWYGAAEYVFSRRGYPTEQDAMNEILNQGGEYTIVKTYQAVDEDAY